MAFFICALRSKVPIRQTAISKASVLRYTIGGYMELAMETFAQDQQSDAVHVEVVAAPWTFT